jgi:hypothetical protein
MTMASAKTARRTPLPSETPTLMSSTLPTPVWKRSAIPMWMSDPTPRLGRWDGLRTRRLQGERAM